jgi:hypothetical protein
MTQALAMIKTTPADTGLGAEVRAACIDACIECAQTCTACADACLAEDMVADLRRCIRTDLDCADICEATGRVLSRQTAYDPSITRAIVEACLTACRACGEECRGHAEMHEHCRVCADQCERCAEACEAVLAAIGE